LEIHAFHLIESTPQTKNVGEGQSDYYSQKLAVLLFTVGASGGLL